MRILHISDSHVGGHGHFNEMALRTLLSEVKEERFDVAIHTGDLTQDGTVEEYRRAMAMFSDLGAPIIFMPGNHDARAGGLDLFERLVGPPNGVTEIGDAIIIHVNSAFEDGNEGRVGMIKFNMIREALNRHSDKPIKVLAMHHHIIPVPSSGRERNILQNAGDILDLIIRDDVDLVLSGHRHYPNLYRIENTVFLNAGTCSGTKTHWGDVNSRNTIDIGPEEMRIVTRRIGCEDQVMVLPRRDKRVYSYFGRRLLRAVHMSNTFISDTSAFLELQFRNAIRTINGLRPDIVIHCGGVVREGIPLYYDMADELLSECEAPIIFSPGGRDINYLGYHLFEEHLGPFEQEFSSGEILFLGLYSPQYDSNSGIIGTRERKALKERLDRAEERTKVVFFHHNVLPIPHSREKGLLEDSGDVLRTLVDSDVDMVLTGTSSNAQAARVNDTIVVNAGSLSSPYQRSLFGNSFNIIDIYQGAIAISEVNSLWGHRRLLGIWDRRKAPAPYDHHRSFST